MKRVVVPLVLAAALFSVNIGGYDLWPADEPRFGEVAREMLQSGDYLVPRVNGQPYQEKPPLLFWTIAAVSRPVGDVTEWSARVPSVVAAVLTLLLTAILARRLGRDDPAGGEAVALWSVVLLMTGARFWWQARTAQTDMLLTAWLTGSLTASWLWHEERRGRWLVLFYAAIAGAIYTKGPPGYVFPLLLVVFFYWKQPAERRKLHFAWAA